MKAVQIREHGGPEAVRWESRAEPEPRPHEVLVRVKAAALNHLDLWVRGGLPGLKLEMPHVLGSDAAGEVVEVGSLCTRLEAGDRVLVAPGKQSWQSPEAMRGLDNFAPDYGLFGHHYPGLQAELVAIPESNALPIPASLPWEQAASVALVFQTAWHMLVGLAKIRFCEDVLILGGSSGVGVAAIQIAKLHHCRVLATAGGEEKLAKARELGADHVIDHYAQDIKAEVRNIVGRKGCEIVFEHVGKATWPHSVACLARQGRLVTCGATTGADVTLNLAHLFAKHLRLQGSFMGNMGELLDVLKLFERGALRAVVDRVFPMEEARAAHKHLEGKNQFGKVVLAA